MIPLQTELQPRAKTDPAVRVCGVEADRYILAPLEFGSNFSMDYDEIAVTYKCEDFKVRIDHESEAELWRRFSTEKFSHSVNARHDQEIEEASLPSPEDIFRAQAAADAEK
jgi:hypothetical protein